MKKLIISFLLITLIVSCDKIAKPDARPPVLYHCIDTLSQIIKSNSTKNLATRKVLIEDYTGHYCPNCPRAAVTGEGLVDQYNGKVVLIAHHVSSTYAKISADSTNKYKEDFRNPESNEWDDKHLGFNISYVGLPQGMVNRVADAGGSFAQQDSKWSSLVSTALAKPFVASLGMTSYYDTLKHYLSVNVKTTFKSALTNNANLILVLTQDSIVACQRDNNVNNAPNDRDPDEAQTRLHYRFDHIVINGINGTQGTLVKAGPIAKNDTASVFSSCYLLNKCFGANNSKTFPVYTAYCVDDRYVNLVAILVDAVTKEVLQVETMKIK